MPVPPVLLQPEFRPLWRRISAALDQRGLDDRRPVSLPAGLEPTVFARLGEVLGRAFPTTKRRLDLDALDRALAPRGTDLLAVLTEAGCAPTGRREQRDAARERLRSRDETLLTAARELLGDEPWVPAWAGEVRATVHDDDSARRAVETVRRVVDVASERGPRSRAEVAAKALGAAHALDRGTLARRWVGTALALRSGAADRDDPQMWAAAGMPADLVATPVLTWALPLLGDGVAAAVRAMTAAGAPTPLTTMTVRELVVDVPPGTVVLSVENPRLLEAAVQQRLHRPVICTMGNPTTAPTMLIRALTSAGAAVRHHGDFDPSGLAIAARLADGLGVEPWRMTRVEYGSALAAAEVDGVELRRIDGPVPPTPWDPELQQAMGRAGRAVDEERVMDELLAAYGSG